MIKDPAVVTPPAAEKPPPTPASMRGKPKVTKERPKPAAASVNPAIEVEAPATCAMHTLLCWVISSSAKPRKWLTVAFRFGVHLEIKADFSSSACFDSLLWFPMINFISSVPQTIMNCLIVTAEMSEISTPKNNS